MAGILSHSERKLLPGGGYRGPEPPAARGGGGGNGGGRGDGDGIPSFYDRLQRYRLGLKFTAVSIVIIFLSFTSLFLARRDAGQVDPVTGVFHPGWQHIELPLRWMLINTLVLGASCLMLEAARRSSRQECILVPLTRIPGVKAIRENSLWWTAGALAGGGIFLAGQFIIWRDMRASGALPDTGPASMFFYLLTGTHALHLIAGLVVMFYICGTEGLRASLERRTLALDVTAWYWHFMAAVWLYVLAVLKWMA